MSVAKYIVYLSIFLPVPVHLSAIHDEEVCLATPFDINVCHVNEAPTFPLIESRIADQVQLCIPTKTQLQPIDFETRGYMYFLDEEPKKPHEILKGVSLDYLDTKGAKSISDLLKIDSAEIVKPKKKNKVSNLWQIDEVKNLRGPQYLPDVVLESDLPQNDGAKDSRTNNQFLDENEKKLGRFVVKDRPPQNRVVNALPIKNAAHFANVEADPKYPRTSHPMAPSIVVSNIMAIREDIQEPTQHGKLEPFVEYSMATNLEDTESSKEIPEETKIAPVPEEIEYSPKEPITVGDHEIEEETATFTEQQTEPKVTIETPVTTPSTTTMSNVVEKNSGQSKNSTSKRRPHRRMKKRKNKNHGDSVPVEEKVGESATNDQNGEKIEAGVPEETMDDRKKDNVETKSRITVENNSALDKLLSVM